MSGKQDKYGSPGSVLPAPSVAINPRTFLEFYLYPMSRIGLSPGNIGVFFKTRYDLNGQPFINFSNVAKQKPLWLVFSGPNNLLLQPPSTQQFYRTEPAIIKVGIV